MKDSGKPSSNVKEPAFAGMFYPSSGDLLSKQLRDLFAHAKKPVCQNPPQALLAPHAGYVFSGPVAASAYNQLPVTKTYDRVFLLASSHQYHFAGVSVGNVDRYKTPLGEIEVDAQVVKYLTDSGRLFRVYPEVHLYEHSLEVQLPFLQHKLGTDFRLVPLILGNNDAGECEKIAHILEPWFKPNNLFLVSTDFSHYPAYNDAVELDFNTAQIICSNNPHALIQSFTANRNIENLITPLCGWTSVVTLMYLTQQKNLEYRLVHYQNSGDSKKHGDRSKVVGYWAIAVFEKEVNPIISRKQQIELLAIARQAIVKYFESKEPVYPVLPVHHVAETAGMFVSIYIDGKLRGCIGNMTKNSTLNDTVRQLAVSACCDQRFDNLQKDELDKMELEISLLSMLRKIESIDEIELGKHGIYIVKGENSGTFLPKVAVKAGWTVEQLLGHCARDKAGLRWNDWKDADIYIYEAFVFRG